ncbi:hypothetical protein AB0C93_11975 [Streptomyces sp. NPDC048518]|uniref:hypothetical protein n=1 Tax=Streptomyces sp. NPDC048518 TaxID=3155029 RepID=UPI0033CA1A82
MAAPLAAPEDRTTSSGKLIDLMAALEESVLKVKGGRGDERGEDATIHDMPKKWTAKKTAAKMTTAAKEATAKKATSGRKTVAKKRGA